MRKIEQEINLTQGYVSPHKPRGYLALRTTRLSSLASCESHLALHAVKQSSLASCEGHLASHTARLSTMYRLK